MDRREYLEASSPSLARLLGAMGSRLGEPGPEDLEAIWQLQLQAPAYVDLSTLNKGPKTGAPNVTFGAILTNSQAPLDWLRLIKDFAKLHLAHEQGPLPKEIADGLYFVAIAAALKFHQTLISSLDPQKISRGFEWCLNQPWIDAKTKATLSSAKTALGMDLSRPSSALTRFGGE
jgi:hypothetical protein